MHYTLYLGDIGRLHNFGSTTRKMKEFVRTFCKLTLVVLLHRQQDQGHKVQKHPIRTKKKHILSSPHRKLHAQCLLKWERTKINNKRYCIFRFQSAASNEEEKSTESKATSGVLPTQNLLFFSICIGDYIDAAMVQSKRLILNTDENYQLLTTARCIIKISIV